jgi:hypothetical protein
VREKSQKMRFGKTKIERKQKYKKIKGRKQSQYLEMVKLGTIKQ